MRIKFTAEMTNGLRMEHIAKNVSKTEEREYFKAFIEYAKETAAEEGALIKNVKADGAIIYRA